MGEFLATRRYVESVNRVKARCYVVGKPPEFKVHVAHLSKPD